MKSLLIVAALSAVALAKPELYKESEDFQYSRSSTDEGSKSGFYGAQRGNMGGNFEKAHNMDGLAQHQMSGLVRQIDGELGDGYKTRTGSVYTAANSRGIYGSGNYDLSNLQGRNFEETEAFRGGSSHSSSMMQSAGLRNQAAINSGTYSSSRAHSNGYRRYQTGASSQQFMHANNLQSADQLQLVDNLQSADQLQLVDNLQTADRLHSAHGYDYGSQAAQFSNTGIHSHQAYDQNNANSRYSGAYGLNTRSHTLSSAPVRVVVRPGTRITVPLTAQTYDASQSASSSDHSSINSDAELLNTNEQQLNNRGVNAPKHYESSYSYHKQWEKHDTQPTTVDTIPTVNPFTAQSELLGGSQAGHLDNSQQRGVNSFDSRASNSAYAASTKSQAATQSRYQAGYNAQQSSSSALTANGYNTNSHASNTNFDANSADSTNLVALLNTKPKSYHSSYSYHKAWERQGDPYVILPAGGAQDSQMSQKLTAASLNQGVYSSHHYGSQYKNAHQSFSQHGVDCCEGHVRMTRSYDPNQEQQFELYQNFNHDQEELRQQAPSHFDNLEDLGQQVQTKWDNLQDLGQQIQDYWDNSHLEQQSQQQWDNLQNLGQQTQEKFDNLEDLGQETEKKFDKLEAFGQQSQSQWDHIQDLGQQTQEKFDKLEDLGQQSQSQWDQLQTLSQQEEEKLDKGKDLGQQSQSPWNKLQDLGQQTQEKFDKLEDLGQQSQSQWDQLQTLSQQEEEKLDKGKDLGQQSQSPWNKLQDLGQQTQEKFEKLEDLGQQAQNKWDKLEDLGQQSQTVWDNTQQQSQDIWDQQSDLSQHTQSNLEQQIQPHGFEEPKEQNFGNSFWPHSTDQRDKHFESAFASNDASKKYIAGYNNKFERPNAPEWKINEHPGVSNTFEYNQNNNNYYNAQQTHTQTEQNSEISKSLFSLWDKIDSIAKKTLKDEDDDDSVTQDSKNLEPSEWAQGQGNNEPMTYLPQNTEINHKIPTTTESDFSSQHNSKLPHDIGRGDIGPEDTDSISETSDISHLEQSYKTPQEIEALSFTQKLNDTSSHLDEEKHSHDTDSQNVLSLDEEKFLEEIKQTLKMEEQHISKYTSTTTSKSNNFMHHSRDNNFFVTQSSTKHDLPETYKDTESLIEEQQEQQNMEHQFDVLDQQTHNEGSIINELTQIHKYTGTLPEEQQNMEQQFELFDHQISTQANRINEILQKHNYADTLPEEQQNLEQQFEDFDQQTQELQKSELTDFKNQMQSSWQLGRNLQQTHNSPQEQHHQNLEHFSEEPILPKFTISKEFSEKHETIPINQSQLSPVHNEKTGDYPNTNNKVSIPSELETQTETPGFWKSVGNKLSNAKSKIYSWFGSK